VVLALRDHAATRARVPLPPPAVHLSAVQTQRWHKFPSYHRVVPVLLYNGISSDGAGSVVRPDAFAMQMLALKTAGFHTITLSQYAGFAEGHLHTLPAKPILLTFDGGSLSSYRSADDILRRYGFHAVMFTFASWPTTNPGFDLTWNELRSMRHSGVWDIQESGGQGRDEVVYDPAGDRGGVDAFREYLVSRARHRGYLESFPSFAHRTTSSIRWGAQTFAAQIPGFQPFAFAVPLANYGQLQTNDRRIPSFVLPWLERHFAVVFGGDYLDPGASRSGKITARSSPGFSYRISVDSRASIPALYCRLRAWATRTPIWQEYRCRRLGPAIPGIDAGISRLDRRVPPP
jgi:Polysaccharide deacetylase